MKTLKSFWRSKTTWGGILGIIITGFAIGSGNMEMSVGLERVYAIIMAMFIRDTIAKSS